MLVLVVTFGISIFGLTLIPGVDNMGNPYRLSFFDAFYFVSYMASTIGFGEAPYSFTYPQRLWVSFCIYLTVIGWFYAIGSIIAVLQNKVLLSQLARLQFQKKIKRLSEPFIIFVGYSLLAKEVIRRLTAEGIQSVVIEKNPELVNILNLENYGIDIPALVGDISDPGILKIAGIHKPNCAAVVSLFNEDAMNLQAALSVKLMNRHVKVIVEATLDDCAHNLKTAGADVVINPFKMVAKRFYSALRAPSLLMLEQWLYGDPLVLRKKDRLPLEGHYIICGFGRMGRALQVGLTRADVAYRFVEADPLKAASGKTSDPVIVGDGREKKVLLEAGVREASCIIAATKDDMLNLSIILEAKRLNTEIFTIARVNNILDTVVFKAAKIDRVITMQQLLVQKTFNLIARPLTDRFIRLLKYRGLEWGDKIIAQMTEKINNNPETCEFAIVEEQAYALVEKLGKDDGEVTLGALCASREDRGRENRILALFLRRSDEEILLPPAELPLRIGDEILFAGIEEAFEEMKTIAQNVYELHYVLTGRERQREWYGLFKSTG